MRQDLSHGNSNAALFAKHLAQSEQFTLDAADTILYGTCADCKGRINRRRTDHDKEACLITRLLAAVLAAVMLSSAVYIAVEANHDCSGEDCAICHQMQVCENLLKIIGLAGAAAAISAAFTYTVCRAILPAQR